ncbi:MAG: TRAP transporter small permease subunit [Inquilinus sp.]|nr:TRAP transporter small permease subunit [Inquilinus sp.]
MARTIAASIDWLNDVVGRTVSWLTLFMVLVQFALVIMRYVFGVGSILVQESLIYAHGTLFMLAAGYTLLLDGHVRVDIFYRGASPRGKALTDLFGVIFLLAPFCILMWVASLPYVLASWSVFEGSRETSGLPAVFLLKSVILAFVVLIALQGLSLAIKSVLVLVGASPTAAPGRHPEA